MSSRSSWLSALALAAVVLPVASLQVGSAAQLKVTAEPLQTWTVRVELPVVEPPSVADPPSAEAGPAPEAPTAPEPSGPGGQGGHSGPSGPATPAPVPDGPASDEPAAGVPDAPDVVVPGLPDALALGGASESPRTGHISTNPADRDLWSETGANQP